MKLQHDFYVRDVLQVAPDLLGCYLVRNINGNIHKYKITEVEAYRGEEDLACHASKGRTKRTEIMYHTGGNIYMYIIYGIHWLLNIVTGEKENPQAVLIRGIENISGPGRVSKALQLGKEFYGEDLTSSERIWIENKEKTPDIITSKRIGIDYASAEWRDKPWRFMAQ